MAVSPRKVLLFGGFTGNAVEGTVLVLHPGAPMGSESDPALSRPVDGDALPL